MAARRALESRSFWRASAALASLIACFAASGCEDEVGCYARATYCSAGLSIWLRSDRWPDGHYEVALESQDIAPLRCSFDVIAGGNPAENVDWDAGTIDLFDPPLLGERHGTCDADPNLGSSFAGVVVGREVDVALGVEVESVAVRVSRAGEPLFEQQLMPEYIEYGDAGTSCPESCRHADVELDLGLQ